ncbi:hypothetical protein GCK32_003743 [Trichostrongylus colubriformis]|uniref:Uncharacterized protein n=1 Tax=Trichostrongylus colubriformis TaxID=6319 RepID=A0AAN8G974_TRICO
MITTDSRIIRSDTGSIMFTLLSFIGIVNIDYHEYIKHIIQIRFLLRHRMYKAGHSAVSRTALPSIQHKQRSTYSYQQRPQVLQKTTEKRQMTSERERDQLLLQSLLQSEISVPVFNKTKLKRNNTPLTLTPPSTPSSPLIEQQIEFLHNSWRSFHETPNGEADPTIVVYRRRKELPPDFEPFNIDRFLAEKLLKELDIDPKFAIF